MRLKEPKLSFETQDNPLTVSAYKIKQLATTYMLSVYSVTE